MITQPRQRHRHEMQTFLESHFPGQTWEFRLPEGSGGETYLARSQAQACFVKIDAPTAHYQAMASIGLAPPVLADGFLEDGTSILVQAWLPGRKPSPTDYQSMPDQFAAAISMFHASPAVRHALAPVASRLHSSAALEALSNIRQRWEWVKPLVPNESGYVDEALNELEEVAGHLQGDGLVASHNDLCNANWLIDSSGRLFLVDLDAMALDDPAFDIGATLWWYYPPEMWDRFLEMAGHANQDGFADRMHVRMAMHCLSISLPRPRSFDLFDPAGFNGQLTDFRAIMLGGENPQGYAGGA